MEWQPIETAVSDETVILGFYAADYDGKLRWVTKIDVAWETKYFMFIPLRRKNKYRREATHWKPLPPPPGVTE